MKKLIAIALLASLAGCQSTRFVTVPCLSPEEYRKLETAEPPKVRDQLTGQAGEDIKTISGSAIRLRAWGQGNLKILSGCVG
jgi:hypothetical protein